eukprot:3719793-Rhodomonas_salina.1
MQFSMFSVPFTPEISRNAIDLAVRFRLIQGLERRREMRPLPSRSRVYLPTRVLGQVRYGHSAYARTIMPFCAGIVKYERVVLEYRSVAFVLMERHVVPGAYAGSTGGATACLLCPSGQYTTAQAAMPLLCSVSCRHNTMLLRICDAIAGSDRSEMGHERAFAVRYSPLCAAY